MQRESPRACEQGVRTLFITATALITSAKQEFAQDPPFSAPC